MGYTTNFLGSVSFNKPLTHEQVRYIQTFAGTRRMKRDVQKLWFLHIGEHGLPQSDNVYGEDGEYFAFDDGNFGQNDDTSVLEHNDHPKTQPGLWCYWTVNDEGTELFWDESEKFYNYVEWLQYPIKHFFHPWNIVLNGKIKWYGEIANDRGYILVENNEVNVQDLD